MENFPKAVSKKVWIMWRNVAPILPEEGLLQASSQEYVLKIGSEFAGFNNPRPKGRLALTTAEEHKYMPSIIGVATTNVDWDAKLDNYWHNFSVVIPHPGTVLEVGMTYNNEEDAGTPINIPEYILYKYCLVYSGVANEKAAVNASKKIRFYLHSEEEVFAKAKLTQTARDAAFTKRMEVQGSNDVRKALITLFGEQMPVSIDAQVLLLAELADKKPERFLELANDARLLAKSFIERCITADVLKRIPNSTIIQYDSEIIGNDLESAVAYLTDPVNAGVKNALQQLLKNKEK